MNIAATGARILRVVGGVKALGWQAAHALALLACALLLSSVLEQPREPQRLIGLVRVDALSALWALLLLTAAPLSGWRAALALGAGLLGLLVSELALIAACFGVASLLVAANRAERWAALGASLSLAIGLGLLGVGAGASRYNLPTIGAGLSSAVFAALFVAAVLGSGLWRAFDREPPQLAAWLVPLWLYPLVRLYSFGEWNLGWQAALLLFGSALLIWAAWQSLRAAPPVAQGWLQVILAAIGWIGVGLSSGAGMACAIIALLARFALAEAPAVRWLRLCALSLPLLALWSAAGALLVGGAQVLVLPLLGAGGALVVVTLRAEGAADLRGGRALLSLGLVLASPALIDTIVPAALAPLRVGLSPYGELEAPTWFSLIVYNSARQVVLSLPLGALIVVGALLAAALWLLRSPLFQHQVADAE